MKKSIFKKYSRWSYLLLIPLVLVGLLYLHHRLWPPIVDTKPEVTSSPQISHEFDKKRYSTDQADSLWVVVNKGRQLPPKYVPQPFGRYGLRQDAGAALSKLLAAAKKSGVPMKVTSGYRSYSFQIKVYGDYVKQSGQAKADTFSARPGHSEHQTGLAADLEPLSGNCRLDICFGQTAEGRWLADNADQYGFIIRYKEDQQNLTGYQYEPWHIRYVGVGLAKELRKTGQTLEQFFGLPTFRIDQAYPRQSFQLM